MIYFEDGTAAAIAAQATITAAKFTLIGSLFGVTLGLFGQWITSFATSGRERESRRESRQEARRERFNDFQRDTLFALQDAALELIQTQAALHQLDRKSYRLHGKRWVEPYPEDIMLKNQSANAKTALLGVRVQDQETRTHLQHLKDYLIKGELFESSEEEAVHSMAMAGRTFVALNNRIGVVLHSTHLLDSE